VLSFYLQDDDLHIVLLREGEGTIGVSVAGETMTPVLSELAVYRVRNCKGNYRICIRGRITPGQS